MLELTVFILYVILCLYLTLNMQFTVLKKNDGYVDSSAKNKNGNEDEEEY